MENLTYRTSKTIGKETIYVTIKLADECKNGHQDFSITGDIYVAGKPRTDKNHIAGGCIHDDILKAFPEFKMFVDLHLSDYRGIPMFAVANGYYHLVEGFNKVKPTDDDFEKAFCDCYRIDSVQFGILKHAESVLHYGILLQDLGIMQQWKEQADETIKVLENLTGEKFTVNSPKDSPENTRYLKHIWRNAKTLKMGTTLAKTKKLGKTKRPISKESIKSRV